MMLKYATIPRKPSKTISPPMPHNTILSSFTSTGSFGTSQPEKYGFCVASGVDPPGTVVGLSVAVPSVQEP